MPEKKSKKTSHWQNYSIHFSFPSCALNNNSFSITLKQATYFPETTSKPSPSLGPARLSKFPCHGLLMHFSLVTFLIGGGWMDGSDRGEEGGWRAGGLLVSTCRLVPKPSLGCQVCGLLAPHNLCLVEDRGLEQALQRPYPPCTSVLFIGFVSCNHPGILFLLPLDPASQLKPSTSPSQAALILQPE